MNEEGNLRMDGAERKTGGGQQIKKYNKKKTCDVEGMMEVSAGIGEIGITGIMGEEGGAASAC